MTLVVAVNLGAYALFAGDTRETLYDPHSDAFTLDEAFDKVRRWPRGLATGAGITRAVFGAIDDWSAHDASVLRPKEITQYLSEFMPAFVAAATQHVSNPAVVPQLSKAGWILSDATEGTMRVRFYHTDFAYEPLESDECSPATLLPIDLNAEISTPFEIRLRDELRPCYDLSRVEGSIIENNPALNQILRRDDRAQRACRPWLSNRRAHH